MSASNIQENECGRAKCYCNLFSKPGGAFSKTCVLFQLEWKWSWKAKSWWNVFCQYPSKILLEPHSGKFLIDSQELSDICSEGFVPRGLSEISSDILWCTYPRDVFNVLFSLFCVEWLFWRIVPRGCSDRCYDVNCVFLMCFSEGLFRRFVPDGLVWRLVWWFGPVWSEGLFRCLFSKVWSEA